MAFWNRWFGKSNARTDSSDPFGRIPPAELVGQARADEWLNIVTGQGMKGRDKRTAAQFVCEPVSSEEARQLWRGDDLAKKTIELLPKAMIREGYKIKTDDTEESGDIADYMDKRRANRVFARAKMYERAYGGAAIWPVMNDGEGNLAMPVREQSIATIRAFQTFEPRELQPMTWYTDPNQEKYGEPETYRVIAINSGGSGFALQTVIHETRLIIFPGIRVSRELPQVESWGWGDSVLTLVRNVLRDFHLTWASAAVLMADISQGVFKFKGLTEMLIKKQDEAVKAKLGVMDYTRSVLQSLTIDAEDDFVRTASSMTGVPEVMIQFATRLSSAAGVPVTKLFGTSPAGMNATGESDTRNWYETVGEEQEEDRPLFERMVRFGLLAKDGPSNGNVPAKWNVVFKPLWAPSEKEQAETRYIVAQTDEILINTGMASADELAKSHYGADEYSIDVDIDFDEREKQAKAGEEAAAAAGSGLGGQDVQAEALNGAQLAAMGEIAEKVVSKVYPRETGAFILQLGFPGKFTQETAMAFFGPAEFEPAPKAGAVPFGGGPKPPTPPDPNAPKDPAAEDPEAGDPSLPPAKKSAA